MHKNNDEKDRKKKIKCWSLENPANAYTKSQDFYVYFWIPESEQNNGFKII